MVVNKSKVQSVALECLAIAFSFDETSQNVYICFVEGKINIYNLKSQSLIWKSLKGVSNLTCIHFNKDFVAVGDREGGIAVLDHKGVFLYNLQ